jgi:hypothetical protein
MAKLARGWLATHLKRRHTMRQLSVRIQAPTCSFPQAQLEIAVARLAQHPAQRQRRLVMSLSDARFSLTLDALDELHWYSNGRSGAAAQLAHGLEFPK